MQTRAPAITPLCEQSNGQACQLAGWMSLGAVLRTVRREDGMEWWRTRKFGARDQRAGSQF